MHRVDPSDAQEKILFARGVLEILRGTGLFNFLIERAIHDLDAVSADLQARSENTPST